MSRLAIIGAGPMGLEAALLGRARGFDVTVFEAGAIGDGVRRWGPTRCFSPVGMNQSARVRAALGALSPPDDALLLGPEIAERVLRPLARSDALAGCVRERARVVAVGRARMARGAYAGHPLRGERPFHLLVESEGRESIFEAERVLDASGVYGQPVPFGAGPPAPGERALGERALRHLGALHDAIERGALDGRRVLLVGHGHSAAHAIGLLDAIAPRGTRVVWAVRTANRRPIDEVAGDPLPERARVARRANELASAAPAYLTVERRASVESVAPDGDALAVQLSGARPHVVDAIVALTGYRPDLSLLDELAVEISPATEGAARLQRAISSVTDCLSVPAVRPEDLASGEPGFHLVGSKSYGRARTFLLASGLAQLEAIFSGL